MRLRLIYYDNSFLSSALSVGGTLFGISSLMLFANEDFDIVETIITCVICLLCVFVFAPFVALRKEKKKMKKKMKDWLSRPEFIERITNSAEKAYMLFKQERYIEILHYIEIHNPYAAQKIVKYLNKEITEEELEKQLHEYDLQNKK